MSHADASPDSGEPVSSTHASGNGNGGYQNGTGGSGGGNGMLSTLNGQANGLAVNGWAPGVPMRPEILTAKPNPIVLMHSVRRRWTLAIGLGTTLALLAAGLVWYFMPVTYEVFALLRVSEKRQQVLRESNEASE